MPSHVPSSARQAVLAPLDRRGRVAEVERRLADAIRVGVFGDGDQLPSEAELAAQLGVATVTLREALVGLRRTGLVETRRGRNGGTFVHAPAEAAAGAPARAPRRAERRRAARPRRPPRRDRGRGRRRSPPSGRRRRPRAARAARRAAGAAPRPTPSAARPTRASTSSSRRRPARCGSRAPRWSCRPSRARSSGSPRGADGARAARWPTTARCSPRSGRATAAAARERMAAHVEAEMAAVVALHLRAARRAGGRARPRRATAAAAAPRRATRPPRARRAAARRRPRRARPRPRRRSATCSSTSPTCAAP